MSVPSFPVDLPGAARGQDCALRWTSVAIGIAALSLALTNAASIHSWGAELPPGPRVALLLDRTDRWRATTDRAGLGTPRASMHRIWRQMEEARWPRQRAAGTALAAR